MLAKLDIPPHLWAVLIVAGLFYIASCVRTARTMRSTGRDLWLWLLISLVATSLPAVLVLQRDRMRELDAEQAGQPPRPEPKTPLSAPPTSDPDRRQ